MHHDLKAHPDSFELIALRQSQVQLRRNDRDFKVGDTCTFYEWQPTHQRYTGRRTVLMPIAIILEKHEGLTDGWCLIVLDVPTENITRFDTRLVREQTI